MPDVRESWQRYWVPVGVCFAALSGTSLLANRLELLPAVIVYLVAGSGLSLVLIARACRAGLLTAQDLGIAPAGWRPQYRLAALVLIVLVACGRLAYLWSGGLSPRFADYAFWCFFLLPSSLAELLVFVSIGFCLPEAWFKRRGHRPFVAVTLAAAITGVAFGLFHLTLDARWQQYALILIPVMWLILLFFALTRNFHLTLLLQVAYAAADFTKEQCTAPPTDVGMVPQTYQAPFVLGLILAAFVVPYVIWHVMEARLTRKEPRIAAQELAT